ncbi:MAG: 4'-phosphopantetheinyl transferase superfamily protein [Oscillospiraceae bacterium]|nr:4'-phosphopantetheinyl transferase superfamily protein [Oscillospiraceae bacterium]
MIKTYILNTDALDNRELFEKKLETVDKERRKKILRLPKNTPQKQSLGAGLLIKTFIGEITSYGIGGKPQALETQFNISHSGRYVVLSVSNEPVGVDIELLQRGRRKIASKFFTLEENIQIDQSYDPDRTFTRLWTLKEAFLKCIGTGIGRNLRKTSINLNGGDIRVEQNINNNPYYFKEYNVEGYQLSVCSEDNEFEEKLTDVTKRILGANTL